MPIASNARRLFVLLPILVVSSACSDSNGPPPSVSVSLETMEIAAEAATPEMSRFLSDTIRFASVEPEGPVLLPDTEALLDYALAQGEEFGFTARRVAGGLVGVLEYGSGEEVVGVLIHLDVVPPGELSDWEHPPFAGVIADGKVFGRGAQDDKAALSGTLWGAKILIDNGMTFPRRLRIILGTKEETSFEDVRTYFAEEEPPDFGLAPDGPFIVRGESGYVDLGYAFSGLATEPGARDTVVYWDGGTVINSVPDLSWAVIRSTDPTATRAELETLTLQVEQEFTRGDKVPDLEVVDYDAFVADRELTGIPEGDLILVSHGLIAHSSIPATGRNAIVEVALVGARMSELSEGAFRRAFEFVDQKIGLSTDGSSFGLERDKPFPQAANTTASLDLARTDPAGDRVELAINFRVGLANTTAEITEKSGAAASDYGAETRTIGTAFDAYHYPDDDPLLQLMVGSYKEVRGADPILLSVGGTTYAKAAPNLLCYGPVDLGEDGLYFHFANEQFPVASLTRNAVLYAHALQTLIQTAESPVRSPDHS
jgi:succinyl-diaminopimelate desuccinylase